MARADVLYSRRLDSISHCNEGFMTPSPGAISRLLVDWRDGDKTALDKLIPLVYREMRRLAAGEIRFKPRAWEKRATDIKRTTAGRFIPGLNHMNSVSDFGINSPGARPVVRDLKVSPSFRTVKVRPLPIS